ncbi:GGDEF domain-containing protein [Kineobactrum sediminis]|nr:GGDEF domain-containing protein [Kineobactrum sediminis]
MLPSEILDTLSEPIVRYQADTGKLRYCNQAWANIHTGLPATFIGRLLDEFLRAQDLAALKLLTGKLAPGKAVAIKGGLEFINRPRDDFYAWSAQSITAGDNADIILVGRDISDQISMRDEFSAQIASFRELADRSADVVFRLQMLPEPHFDYMSPSVETLTGYPAEELRDLSRFLDILHREDREHLQAVLAGGQTIGECYDLRFIRRDGISITGEIKVTLLSNGLLGVGRDVTETRKLQGKLAALALRDPLTGLANRRLLDEVFAIALQRADRSGQALAVALLDMDGFKEINDTYGHEAGDALLVETAKRLSTTVREADVVARIGGDEFVILHEAGADTVGTGLRDRLVQALSLPVDIGGGVMVRCPASIGVVDTHCFGLDAAKLLAAADAAMYEVKRKRD